MVLEKLLPYYFVRKNYVEAGGLFGNAVSYLSGGEPEGFAKLLGKWEKWETEYARRGYRTIDLDRFKGFGAYGESLESLLDVQRRKGEEPVLHAKNYRNESLE